MVQCDSWYHYRCVGIKRKPKIFYLCTVYIKLFLILYLRMHILLFLFPFVRPSSFCATFVCTSLKTIISLTVTVDLRGVIFSRGGSLVPRS